MYIQHEMPFGRKKSVRKKLLEIRWRYFKSNWIIRKVKKNREHTEQFGILLTIFSSKKNEKNWIEQVQLPAFFES